jgi:phosphoglycolate phosphatase-like HAD superfamily hydrolase
MRVCLFDIDGTLLSSGGAGKAAMEAALVEEFGLPGVLHQISYSGRTDRAITWDLLHAHQLDPHDSHRERLLNGYLRRLPDSLCRGQGRVLPGIHELLDELGQRDDVVLGLLTGNIRAGSRIKLGHFGIDQHFRFGGYGDEHLDRDDVARAALADVHRHLNGTVRPEHIWVIGDTPLDVRCARAIGANVAAVATGWHTLDELRAAEPDLLFADLADAASLLVAF